MSKDIGNFLMIYGHNHDFTATNRRTSVRYDMRMAVEKGDIASIFTSLLGLLVRIFLFLINVLQKNPPEEGELSSVHHNN